MTQPKTAWEVIYMNLQTINPYIRFARIKELTIPQGVSQAVDHRIFYCHSGKGQLEADGILYPFTAGALIYLPAGTPYRYLFEQEIPVFSGCNFDFYQDHNTLNTPIPPVPHTSFSKQDILEKQIFNEDDIFSHCLYLENAFQFEEKFAEIQKEFDRSFKQLFGGGHGTLELVEDEDILECGIRIIAQPPGKKLQNMMQLSGGEKALTAIALLFAIQALKPSPFCLLDEIEAALDDSNVTRFAQYLNRLTKNTQYIVITHRRGTMAAADRLYGITMQEKGVSALVSVNLIENDLSE